MNERNAVMKNVVRWLSFAVCCVLSSDVMGSSSPQPTEGCSDEFSKLSPRSLDDKITLTEARLQILSMLKQKLNNGNATINNEIHLLEECCMNCYDLAVVEQKIEFLKQRLAHLLELQKAAGDW
jgi:hypothetical protein